MFTRRPSGLYAPAVRRFLHAEDGFNRILGGKTASWAAPVFVGSDQQTPNQVTHTYSGFTLPASKLVLVVWANGDSPVDDIVVQVGGNSVTQRADNDLCFAGETMNIYEYTETTGGSINITVAHPSPGAEVLFRSALAVYDVKNLTFKTSSDTYGGGNPNTSAPVTNTMTNTVGSCAILGCMTQDAGFTSFAGSNGLPSTADGEETVESRHVGFFMQPSTAGGSPESFTVDVNGGTTLNSVTSVIYE